MRWLLVPLTLGLSGCAVVAIFDAAGGSKLELIGHATVQDFIVSDYVNDPPVRNDRTFEIIAVDGHRPEREPLPHPGNSHPAVWVAAGRHSFRAAVFLAGEYVPSYDSVFTTEVCSGKRYLVYSKNGEPALVEVRHQAPRKPRK